MSDYEYTDTNGRLMKVKADRFAGDDRVLIQFHREAEGVFAEAARCIRPDDAPAVALAILEASGIEGAFYINTPSSNDPGGLLACATFLLRQAKNRRAERAEREAEDAKVRAWLDHLRGGPTTTPITDWDRRTYRKHESFFQSEGIVTSPKGESKTAPRVLNHGDPLEDINAKFQTPQGYSVEYDPTYGKWAITAKEGPKVYSKRLDTLPRTYFPMTEVL